MPGSAAPPIAGSQQRSAQPAERRTQSLASARCRRLAGSAHHLPRLRIEDRRGIEGAESSVAAAVLGELQRLGKHVQRVDAARATPIRIWWRRPCRSTARSFCPSGTSARTSMRVADAAADAAHAAREPGAREHGGEHDDERERDLLRGRSTPVTCVGPTASRRGEQMRAA